MHNVLPISPDAQNHLFSDADIRMVANFDFPRTFFLYIIISNPFSSHAIAFSKTAMWEASSGFPRLKLMVTVEGSSFGINCYVFMTKVVGYRLWFHLERYGPCQVYLPGTWMNTSPDMGKEVVTCSAAQQLYDHTHSWDGWWWYNYHHRPQLLQENIIDKLRKFWHMDTYMGRLRRNEFI